MVTTNLCNSISECEWYLIDIYLYESTVSFPLVSKELAKVMENFGGFDQIFFLVAIFAGFYNYFFWVFGYNYL